MNTKTTKNIIIMFSVIFGCASLGATRLHRIERSPSLNRITNPLQTLKVYLSLVQTERGLINTSGERSFRAGDPLHNYKILASSGISDLLLQCLDLARDSTILELNTVIEAIISRQAANGSIAYSIDARAALALLNADPRFFENSRFFFAKGAISPVKTLFDSIDNEEELNRALEEEIEQDEAMKRQMD